MGDALPGFRERKTAIPPKQRRAAALLLCAIELPCEVGLATGAMLEAARIDPELNAADMPSLSGNEGRLRGLREVRAMIDELIEGAE